MDYLIGELEHLRREFGKETIAQMLIMLVSADLLSVHKKIWGYYEGEKG